MFNQAIAGQGLPTRLSTDHDPLFRFHRWQANLRILGVETVQTVPQVPWSHPFIERLIGTIRREYLDRLFFWTADDLERKLDLFKNYYNAARVHQGLSGDTPREKAEDPTLQLAGLENYRWQSHCHGLFELPIAAGMPIRHVHGVKIDIHFVDRLMTKPQSDHRTIYPVL